MTLRELPFNHRFMWKGKKYMQFIRPKHPKNKAFKIICAEIPQGETLKMPSGRKVKPILRISA